MSRSHRRRLEDIEAACLAIQAHLQRGDLHDGLIFDAVRIRIVEIGEAVKGIDAAFLATEHGIRWKQVARMRDHLTHRYFDTAFARVQEVVAADIDPLLAAVRRLAASLPDEKADRDATDG